MTVQDRLKSRFAKGESKDNKNLLSLLKFSKSKKTEEEVAVDAKVPEAAPVEVVDAEVQTTTLESVPEEVASTA